MRMSKFGFVALFALIITIPGNTAHADKLDLKWAAARREANALGDRAKAGDVAAVRELGGISLYKDNAPFAHNMGWVHQHGYAGQEQDMKFACGYYVTAAEDDYPPAMHAYANLCLLPIARSTTGESALEADRKARGMLLSSARLGWPASAILFAELMLNRRGPEEENAREAGKGVEAGLASDPNLSQKVTLSYLQGAVAIYSNGRSHKTDTGKDALRIFRQGEEALKFAASHGHTPAKVALLELHELWVKSVDNSAAAWSDPGLTLDECVDSVQSDKPDQGLASSCNYGYIQSKSLLGVVIEDLEYLIENLNELDKDFLQGTVEYFGEKTSNFRAEQPVWEEKFRQRYVERVNTKDWGE